MIHCDSNLYADTWHFQFCSSGSCLQKMPWKFPLLEVVKICSSVLFFFYFLSALTLRKFFLCDKYLHNWCCSTPPVEFSISTSNISDLTSHYLSPVFLHKPFFQLTLQSRVKGELSLRYCISSRFITISLFLPNYSVLMFLCRLC
jgi:hypothetical protein